MAQNKMNKMVELALQDKTFRENYENKKQDRDKISTTFLKNKEDNMKDEEIELVMEWLENQRFPRLKK